MLTMQSAMKVKKGDSSDAVIDIGPCDGNATPAVVAAASRLRDGGTLRFAPGEYHFFEEGAKDLFLASPGSSTGPKKVAIHIEGRKDVTIDGGGARFVFHGQTFPIVAQRCDGLAIRNFTSRVFQPAIAEFTILEKGDDGFLCQFAPDSPPYETTDDGTILFDTDEGRIRLSAFADILFENNRLSNGQSVMMVDDLTGYWGECGPVHNLTARGNDCADMRHTFFDFHVPFTGRAVVEGNRLSGPGSDNPFTLGPGVEVARGAEDAPTASGRAASRAPAPPSLPQPCKER